MQSKQTFLKICTNLKHIIKEIELCGGTSYMVGGSVRDLVLNKPIKDADIEVHGTTQKKLESILKKFGPVIFVGQKFGVLRLKKFDVDWSLPRKDSKGRKPIVKIDPFLSIEIACKRRDLTMNAMAINLNFVCKNLTKLRLLKGTQFIKTLQIIDPYGGLKDITKKQLCAVDKTLFIEDPLRFFRVMQFIGRFEMQPDKNLNNICKNMALCDPELNKPLARERIFEEIKKLFLKSKKPSLGIRWLLKIERLNEIFPEIYNLIGTKQNPKYHPEGDVFEHTMQVLDAAANIEFYDKKNIENEKFLVIMAAFCHDLGKPKATDAELHARGHERMGVPICNSLLKRLTNQKTFIIAVKKLVEHHRAPAALLSDGAELKAYKRLALKLSPEATLRHLGLLTLADMRGRKGKSKNPFKKKFTNLFLRFMQKVKAAQVENKPEPAVLLGRHLIDCVKPGPDMGRLLNMAYTIQIEENIKNWMELKKRVLSYPLSSKTVKSERD